MGETLYNMQIAGENKLQEMLESVLLPNLGRNWQKAPHDGALLDVEGVRLAFTTDSYISNPIEFPGGDMGTLAVNGTVNDLAMCGAVPQYLSASFIVGEGLARETLERVATAMKEAADKARVEFVTGDTKIVSDGRVRGLIINTSGIGYVEHAGPPIGPEAIRSGDAILLSGDIGRHGVALAQFATRNDDGNPVESDCAPLAAPVLHMLAEGITIHCLRDLTGGGLTRALEEISRTSGCTFDLDYAAVPVSEEVLAACTAKGLDPMHEANEGRFIAFVPQDQVERALQVMRDHCVSRGSVAIGDVV